MHVILNWSLCLLVIQYLCGAQFARHGGTKLEGRTNRATANHRNTASTAPMCIGATMPERGLQTHTHTHTHSIHTFAYTQHAHRHNTTRPSSDPAHSVSGVSNANVPPSSPHLTIRPRKLSLSLSLSRYHISTYKHTHSHLVLLTLTLAIEFNSQLASASLLSLPPSFFFPCSVCRVCAYPRTGCTTATTTRTTIGMTSHELSPELPQ